MTEPTLQTKLTVVSGATSEPRMTFVWGQQVSPIAVGARGEWAISAPGVLDVHLFVSFDGRQVHVAPAAPAAQVTIREQVIEQRWQPVPVPSEVGFGGARIAVICEDRISARPAAAPTVSPGGLERTWGVEEGVAVPPAALAPAGATPGGAYSPDLFTKGGTKSVAAVQLPAPAPQAPPQQPSGAPAVSPMVRTVPVQAVTAVQPARPTGNAPAPAGHPPLTPPVAGPGGGAPPGFGGVGPPGPTGVPQAASRAQSVVPPTPKVPEPARAAAPADAASAATEELPVSTVADGGRLREHAERLNESLELPQVPRGYPPPGAKPAVPADATFRTAPSPVYPEPEAATAGAPNGGQSQAGTGDKKPSALAVAWKETSLAKKAILALLPLAGVAALLLEPGEVPEPPAGPAKPTASAAEARTAAPSGAESAHAVATPSAAEGRVDSIAKARVDAGAAAVAAQATAGSAEASSSPVGSASGSPIESSPLPRSALDAVFSGRRDEAADLYRDLAKQDPDNTIYPLVERLVREGAVRTQ